MFKLELTDHKTLKSAFESIHKIVDEIVLSADSETLYLRALTRDHIMFVTMELNKTFFDEYQCDEPEQMFLDANEFYKMLKKAKSDDILELTINESGVNIILKGKGTRRFNLTFLDFSYDNPVPPKIECPCNIRISSSLLKEYIDNMSDFSDRLIFQVDQDYFKILTDGQIGTAEIEYMHGENINESVSSQFSIPKLQDMLKSSKFSEECQVNIGNDMPLVLRLDLVTGDGYLEYLLAPRIDESN